MAENLAAKTRNSVHSDANRTGEALINVNFSEISDDRRPILSLQSNMPESMDHSSNVPESLPNSDSTPDSKEWFLYRPRTRSARKKLLFAKVVVISSDSEGSDVESTHNSSVTEVVMKKEKFSDDPQLEETAVSGVNVSDMSELFKDQNIATGNSAELFVSGVGCSRNSYITEIAMKKEDESPLEEAVVSDVFVTDKSEILEEQAIPTDDCVEPVESHGLNVDRLEVNKKKTVNSDDPELEGVDVSDVTDTDYLDFPEEQGILADNCVEIVDPDGSNEDSTEVNTKKTVNSDDPQLEGTAVSDVIVTDKSEILEEQAIPTDDCVEPVDLHGSNEDCTVNTEKTVNSDSLEEVEVSDVTDPNYSDFPEEQGIVTKNCVELRKSDVNCSNSFCDTEIGTNTIVISNEFPFEKTIVSDVAVNDHRELLNEHEVLPGGCGEVHNCLSSTDCHWSQLFTSPLQVPSFVNTTLFKTCTNLKTSCIYVTDSTQPIADDISKPKPKNLLSAQSNDTSHAIETDSSDSGLTEMLIDTLDESKTNIWSDRNPNYEAVEHNSTNNQSTGQSKRKYNLCECSTCGKCENVMSNVDNTTGMVVVRSRHLKPKCLQFERECEGNSNDSIVKLIGGKISSTPTTSTTQNSMNDANSARSGSEDSPVERLEWSSEHDVQFNEESADDSESMHEDENLVEVVSSSDYELLDKLHQRVDEKYFESRSMSDDEFVKSGRYGVQMKNDSIDLLTMFCSSANGKLNSMNERMFRASDYAVPNLKNENSPIVKVGDRSVGMKSQDEVLSVEESPTGNSEYEREYGQRPPERDDKLLARIKRRRSAAELQYFADISAKRNRTETTTAIESDSDTEKIQRTKRTHRQPKTLSHKVIERMGGFFRKWSKNLREKRKKMNAKLSRKSKSFPKIQETTAEKFVVTPYREDKVVEHMKGFVITPGRRLTRNKDV